MKKTSYFEAPCSVQRIRLITHIVVCLCVTVEKLEESKVLSDMCEEFLLYSNWRPNIASYAVFCFILSSVKPVLNSLE